MTSRGRQFTRPEHPLGLVGPGSTPRHLLTPARPRLGGLLAFAVGLAPFVQAAPLQPNIVVILADDMGYGDVSAYNPRGKTATPTIDRLAAAGLRFTDGHVSDSVCSPSRYGLLTGRYAWRSALKHSVLPASAPMLIEDNCDTLAAMLKRHGYSTAVIGKWHLGLGTGSDLAAKYANAPAGLRPGPNQRGFDYSFIIPASANMLPIAYLQNLTPVNGVDGSASPPYATWPRTEGNGRYPLPQGYVAGAVAPGIDPNFDAHPAAKPRFNKVLPRLTDEAVTYLNNRPASEPFFLYFALPSPHTPWVPDIDPASLSDEELYLAYVEETDAAVGRVIATLRRTGAWENTLVVFSSDNGPELQCFSVAQAGHDPAGGLRGQKSDLYEAGHREPFVVTWPGHVPAGQVSDQLVSTLDLYQTFAALVGDRRPAGLRGGEDSYDLGPLLFGHSHAAIRTELVLHSNNGHFGLRQDHWVYLDCPGGGGYVNPDHNAEGTPGQLFDLSGDLAEAHNLYREQGDQVARLKAALARLLGADASAAPSHPPTLPPR